MLKVIKTKPTTMRTSPYSLNYGERFNMLSNTILNRAFKEFCSVNKDVTESYEKLKPSHLKRFHQSSVYRSARLEINAAKTAILEPIVIATLKAIPVMDFDVANEMGHPDDLKRFKDVIEAVRKA